MHLFQHPLSPFAQKVRIALREKGQPFELGAHKPGDQTELVSPRREYPVLIVDGVRIFDSTIILAYLEDAYPTPALLPEKPGERARVRMIEEVCDTHYEAIVWGMGEVRYFRRGGEVLGAKLWAAALQQTAHIYGWLERQLGNAHWFNGESFGWGDLSVAPYVAQSASFGVSPRGALREWFERIQQRESVRLTFAEAEAARPGMADAADRIARRVYRRHFRDHRLEWMIRSGGLQVVQDGLQNDDIRFTETIDFLTHSILEA
jgi:glutathione S-transferase